ncbi:hypothetical protein [Endozoicomonas sp. ALC066]|uniref:hypothetical protein n=1 Tax=Endozoicomonas sp. ALC066 TaxID=3403078 RepID=UPI003BB59927
MEKESEQLTEDISPVVSFRSKELAARILRLATLERRKKGNMAMLLVEDALKAEEQSRGLPPINEDPQWAGTENSRACL